MFSKMLWKTDKPQRPDGKTVRVVQLSDVDLSRCRPFWLRSVEIFVEYRVNHQQSAYTRLLQTDTRGSEDGLDRI